MKRKSKPQKSTTTAARRITWEAQQHDGENSMSCDEDAGVRTSATHQQKSGISEGNGTSTSDFSPSNGHASEQPAAEPDDQSAMVTDMPEESVVNDYPQTAGMETMEPRRGTKRKDRAKSSYRGKLESRTAGDDLEEQRGRASPVYNALEAGGSKRCVQPEIGEHEHEGGEEGSEHQSSLASHDVPSEQNDELGRPKRARRAIQLYAGDVGPRPPPPPKSTKIKKGPGRPAQQHLLKNKRQSSSVSEENKQLLHTLATDGKQSICLVWKVLEDCDLDAARDYLRSMNLDGRLTRLRRIHRGIKVELDKGGYNPEEFTQSLETARVEFSLYTMADFADQMCALVARVLSGDLDKSALHDVRPHLNSRHCGKKSARTKVVRAENSKEPLPPTQPPPPPKEPPEKIPLLEDQSTIYVEETAFMFHDPRRTCDGWEGEECIDGDLKPLPEPEPLPVDIAMRSEMNDGISGPRIKWRIDEEQRIVYASFAGLLHHQIVEEEWRIFRSMMERDDLTVISEGLLDLDGLDPDLWSITTIQEEHGGRVNHKVKRFIRSDDAAYQESHQNLECDFKTYCNYVLQHQGIINNDDQPLILKDDRGKDVNIDVGKDSLYMIDVDFPRLMPRMFADFFSKFKIPEMLPGGSWCMMSPVPPAARPPMGPLLYMTPGGSFTHFHQDGHGTVDSGHIALSGYNEVIMLRRLPERHKMEASKHVPNIGDYDALYRYPHQGDPKPGWPTQATIQKWKEMNYCPSVFILEPGQHVHINKGRLHAFRKMTNIQLSKTDCHYDMRMKHIVALHPKVAPFCLSVAWDWQYWGGTPEGINRELTSMLECQQLVRQKKDLKCLAIPKTCILYSGQQLKTWSSKDLFSLIGLQKRSQCEHSQIAKKQFFKGVSPALGFLLKKNLESLDKALEMVETRGAYKTGRLSCAPKKDTAINPQFTNVDPDGNDYFCQLCGEELENLYFHCDGCEHHLQKDFNICAACHENKLWEKTIVDPQMTECPPMNSGVIHTGAFVFKDKCSCDSGQILCPMCEGCTGCGCSCHSCFTVRRRYFERGELAELLRLLNEFDMEGMISHANLTKARLLIAEDRRGQGHKEKLRLAKLYQKSSVFEDGTEEQEKQEKLQLRMECHKSLVAEEEKEDQEELETPIEYQEPSVGEERKGDEEKNQFGIEYQKSAEDAAGKANEEPCQLPMEYQDSGADEGEGHQETLQLEMEYQEPAVVGSSALDVFDEDDSDILALAGDENSDADADELGVEN